MDSLDKLSPLQQQVLRGFFENDQDFFLTGGAALVGHYLGHRSTQDLDLFTNKDIELSSAERTVRFVAHQLKAEIDTLVRSPDFLRLALKSDAETVVLDLVVDRVAAVYPNKLQVGFARLDVLDEIAANKLTTILGRTAPRDLLDLKLILERGLELVKILDDAKKKDAGVDPASLAWVLSRYRLNEAALPEQTTLVELENFREDLVQRLSELAFPSADPH